MNVTKSRLVIGMTAMVVLLVLGASTGAARAAAADDLYRNASLASHPLTSIAILPVVSVSENADAERLVEESWVQFCGETGIRWMRADDVRVGLASGSAATAALGAAAEREIWRRGEVDSEVAGALARALGVDAVLSVRVDRWEIVDGGRAMVEMTAVLSGADGTRLWGISGTAGCGAQRSSTKRNFSNDLGWIWPARLEPREFGHEKLGCALYTLLARWEGALPEAPAYAHSGSAPAETSAIE
jgi:hypothetical protein